MDHREMLADVRRSGLTQADVAAALGITQGSVSKIERGETKELRASVFVKLQALHSQIEAKPAAETSIVANTTDASSSGGLGT